MQIFYNCLKAFIVGGTICAIGQILIDYTKLTPAKILTSFVITGVFLGAVGLYAPIVEYAGFGATVPLTGFGFNLAKGVKEAVEKDGFFGIFTGPLTACSAGVTAAVVFGIITALLSKSKPKA